MVRIFQKLFKLYADHSCIIHIFSGANCGIPKFTDGDRMIIRPRADGFIPRCMCTSEKPSLPFSLLRKQYIPWIANHVNKKRIRKCLENFMDVKDILRRLIAWKFFAVSLCF